MINWIYVDFFFINHILKMKSSLVFLIVVGEKNHVKIFFPTFFTKFAWPFVQIYFAFVSSKLLKKAKYSQDGPKTESGKITHKGFIVSWKYSTRWYHQSFIKSSNFHFKKKIDGWLKNILLCYGCLFLEFLPPCTAVEVKLYSRILSFIVMVITVLLLFFQEWNDFYNIQLKSKLKCTDFSLIYAWSYYIQYRL